MHNYIALIFNDTGKAYKALHALWQMDGQGDITVHGATVVHRNNWGEFQVDTKETEPAMATAFGVGIGRGWSDYGSDSCRHSRSSDR